MEYDKEFLKQQFSLQGITVDEKELPYVQRVLSIITETEKNLEDFSDIEDQSIILTMDMEEPKHD